MLGFAAPTSAQALDVFNPIMRARFDIGSEDEVVASMSSIASKLLPATLRVWEWARRRHSSGTEGLSVALNFGLHDISRVISGVCKVALPSDRVQN